MRIQITAVGCDGATSIEMECTIAEFDFLIQISEKMKQTHIENGFSDCHAIIKVFALKDGQKVKPDDY